MYLFIACVMMYVWVFNGKYDNGGEVMSRKGVVFWLCGLAELPEVRGNCDHLKPTLDYPEETGILPWRH